jgi:lipopolysaccharide export system permease protein
MWRESEMVVWLNSGLSMRDWVRPVLSFATPYVALILLLTGFLDPWARLKKSDYRQELKSRSDAAMIAPGLFVESNAGDTVYFVGAMNPLTGVVRNVFMQSTQNGQLGVTAAQEGRQSVAADGTRYLVLDAGRRYEGEPGSLSYRIVDFSRYWMRLDPVEVAPDTPDLRENYLHDIARDPSPAARAELLWRIGMPVSALVLALAAIPLSFVNVRARRSYGLVLALLLYFIYNNLLSLSQAWVAQGKLDPWVGMVALHLIVLAGVAWLFAARMRPHGVGLRAKRAST